MLPPKSQNVALRILRYARVYAIVLFYYVFVREENAKNKGALFARITKLPYLRMVATTRLNCTKFK